jgi:aryl-alcohol dehydrogenase-like predicted oxidoreductase
MTSDTKLPRRRLGASGLEAGAVGLGCMGMTWAYNAHERDDARSVRVIHRALDLGMDLIDTADMYGPFTNEEVVGRALAGRRDRAVLATKVGLVVEDRATFKMVRDGSPQHVREGIDASLGRLGVDHVDLWQLHRVDEKVPVEETWGAMAEAAAAGKTRAIGMSEATVEELERAHAIHPVASVQSELSLWTRDRLADVLPWCRAHDVAFIPFAPLGRGYLTGTVTADSFDDRDFRARNPRFTREALDANLAIVDRVKAVAARYGATAAQVALAWVLAQDELILPIPGTTRVERVEENAGAATLALTPADLAELDGAPAGVGARYCRERPPGAARPRAVRSDGSVEGGDPGPVVRAESAAGGLVRGVHHGVRVRRVAEAGDVAVLVQEDGLEVERAAHRAAAERPAVPRVDGHVGLVDAAGRPGDAERAVGQPRPADVVEAVVALRARALADERGAAGGRPARLDAERGAGDRAPGRVRAGEGGRAVDGLAGGIVVLPHRQVLPPEAREGELVGDGGGALGADRPVLGRLRRCAVRHGDEDLDNGFLAGDVRRSEPGDDAVGSRRGCGG